MSEWNDGELAEFTRTLAVVETVHAYYEDLACALGREFEAGMAHAALNVLVDLIDPTWPPLLAAQERWRNERLLRALAHSD